MQISREHTATMIKNSLLRSYLKSCAEDLAPCILQRGPHNEKPLQIQRHKPDASNSDPHTLPPGSLSLLVNKVFESPNRHITTEVAAISRLHRVFMQTCSLTLTSYYLTKMVWHARKLMISGHKEGLLKGGFGREHKQ